MSRAEKISRMKAEQARDRYYSRHIERQETADTADRPAVYVGYDADSGSHITQRTGHNPVSGAISLTNGGLSEGEAIVQTGGSNSFAAMPHPRRRRRRRRRIRATETLMSVLFLGARDLYKGGFGAVARTLIIWFADSNQPGIQRFEIDMIYQRADGPNNPVFIGGAKGEFPGSAYYAFLSPDERIVQIFVSQMKATGASSGDRANPTTAIQQSGKFEVAYDLLTVHLRDSAVVQIELTTIDTFASDGKLIYTSYWDSYLPYLLNSKEFDPERLNPRLTVSPIGKFSLTQPPKPDQGADNFQSLKNFFGENPPAYALNAGDPITFALDVNDLGFKETDKSFVTADGRTFLERLKIEDSSRLSNYQGRNQLDASYIHIQCGGVRGFVE